MSDESMIVKGTGSIVLAGPYLVKAAIGEEVDQETLGGAETQSNISGITDHIAENDQDCLDKIRAIVRANGTIYASHLQKSESQAPAIAPEQILENLPESRHAPYDSHEIQIGRASCRERSKMW